MAWLYFGIIIVLVAGLFIFAKRPMYEVMFTAFIFLAVITGNIGEVGRYLLRASNTMLLFTMMAFTVFAVIFERTGIIEDLINIIVSIVGRFSGGAGYVALLASAAMGSFCGTGPGTCAATGSITIPAMKETGFSSETAAVISAAGSTPGPIIPPSAAIPIMYVMLEAVCPGKYTASEFWMLAWPVSFWLIIQRVITLYIVVKQHHVEPIPKEKRLSLKTALIRGWRTLLLPLIIFLPFLFDMLFSNSFIMDRLGEAGAAHFSTILLVVVPSIGALAVLILYRCKGEKIDIGVLTSMVADSISSVAPIIIMCLSGYAMNELFADVGITSQLVDSFVGMNLPKWVVALVGPLFFTVMGMFMETSSVYLLFGPVFIPLAVSVGINPMVAAMQVNVMTNAMGQISPPFALSLFVAMGIANSDFKKTSKEAIIWCFTQYIFIVLMLFELLPMFGLVF